MSNAIVVINQRDPTWKEYHARMVVIENSDAERKESEADYWWSVWEIYSLELYLAGGFASWEKWLADFTTEPFGNSRSDVWEHMKLIKVCKKLGYREPGIREKLGKWNTALKEFSAWFDKDLSLKDDIAKALAEQNITPKEVIEEVVKLSPSQGRTHVGNYIAWEHVFATDEAVYDEKTGRFYFNVRHESDENGLMHAGTITVTYTPTHPEPKKGDGRYIPQSILDWIRAKVGGKGKPPP